MPRIWRVRSPSSRRVRSGSGNWWIPERIVWTTAAWDDYVYWQTQDRKTLRRINQLIQNTLRNPFSGIGKPEPLKANLSGFWSRRIDDTHRLVYAVSGNDLAVIACRYHYD